MRCLLEAFRIMRRELGGRARPERFSIKTAERGAALAKKNWIGAGVLPFRPLRKKPESQPEEQRWNARLESWRTVRPLQNAPRKSLFKPQPQPCASGVLSMSR